MLHIGFKLREHSTIYIVIVTFIMRKESLHAGEFRTGLFFLFLFFQISTFPHCLLEYAPVLSHSSICLYVSELRLGSHEEFVGL